jgi:hypothetical protein
MKWECSELFQPTGISKPLFYGLILAMIGKNMAIPDMMKVHEIAPVVDMDLVDMDLPVNVQYFGGWSPSCCCPSSVDSGICHRRRTVDLEKENNINNNVSMIHYR